MQKTTGILNVIVLSKNVKNMLSAKVRWSDKSFLDDCL